MEAAEPVVAPAIPALIEFEGDWDVYEEELYEIFKKTICEAALVFQGQKISIKRHEEHKGKHFTFWHLTSEGEKEEERTPDLRRCERISWVGWIITNCASCPEITFWENKRKGQTHVVIWYEKHEYAVILAKRSGYFLLKTAYVVNEDRAKTFRRERDEFNKRSK